VDVFAVLVRRGRLRGPPLEPDVDNDASPAATLALEAGDKSAMSFNLAEGTGFLVDRRALCAAVGFVCCCLLDFRVVTMVQENVIEFDFRLK
jgi:hypothetical protein